MSNAVYHEHRGRHHVGVNFEDKAAVANLVQRAAKALQKAECILITAGAGMVRGQAGRDQSADSAYYPPPAPLTHMHT